MSDILACRICLKWIFAGLLSLSLCSQSVIAKDIATHGRTSEPDAIPEFHPELGLDALQGYLDPKALPNSLELLPPPPEPGSAAFANDEAVARATFALRDTPRFALAVSDFDLKLPRLIDDFSCALDAQITAENAPYLTTLLRRSFSDLGLATYGAKNYYKRKRPFQLNELPMGVPEYRAQLEKDPSYPSGHTAIGWGFGLILSELAPDRADELLARGRAFGESRIVVNHHWYSDVVWGRAIGAATVARLHADATFRADLDAAREEIADVRAKGVPPAHDCKIEAAALAQGFQDAEVTAIDILLEPDATMLQHAEANNARLRTIFPKGYTLDATHRPHITMMQLRAHLRSRQGLLRGRSRHGERQRHRDETGGVQILLYPCPGHWRGGGSSQRRLPNSSSSRPISSPPCSPPCRKRRFVRVRDHAGRSGHRPPFDRLRVVVRIEILGRELQSACHHRRRPQGGPRSNARRAV